MKRKNKKFYEFILCFVLFVLLTSVGSSYLNTIPSKERQEKLRFSKETASKKIIETFTKKNLEKIDRRKKQSSENKRIVYDGPERRSGKERRIWIDRIQEIWIKMNR